MPRIMELVEPVVKSGIKSNENKMPESMFRTGRLSVSVPGSILFFNATGCLTAMLDHESLAQDDKKCLEGEKVPTIGDFHGKTSTAGKPAIILLSPLYNVDALKALRSGKDAFWDEQRAALDTLQLEIGQKFPEAAVHPVYIPFGQ